MSQIYAELSVICKNRNLKDLSLITGLNSSEEYNINDVTKRGKILDHSLWEYRTDIIKTYYIEEVSLIIRNSFNKNLDKLCEFIHKNDYNVIICYVVEKIMDVIPDLTIDVEMINFAAKLNAKIYFDGLGQLAAYLPENTKT